MLDLLQEPHLILSNMETGQFAILVPVIVGLVQVVRKTGLKTRYLPLSAVLLGIVSISAIYGVSGLNAFSGIVVGLSAAGLYSGVKTTVKG